MNLASVASSAWSLAKSAASTAGNWISKNSNSLVSGASSIIGGMLGHSSDKPLWKQAYWNNKLAELASARELSNSKELYDYQQKFGPSLTVEGLRMAGLNPILAAGGDIGSVPHASGGSPGGFDFAASTQGRDSRRLAMASAVQSLASNLQSIRESESRVEANRASAKNLTERSETETALREYRAALTYYKAVSESHAPVKLKAFLERQASDMLINASRRALMASQEKVNAKQLEVLDARKRYLDELIRRDSRFGYNNTYINFSVRELLKEIADKANSVSGPVGLGR